MPEISTTMAIGLDGGGTKCRLRLWRADAPAVTVTGGAANVTSDFDGAIGEIRRLFDALARTSGVPLHDLFDLPAYLGLAGVMGEAMAKRVAAELPLTRVRVEDDRKAAVTGALGPQDGALAHCGTGSFLALKRRGRIDFAGGWGALLGDEASAQWVGRKALGAALRVADGRADASDLTAQIMDRFAATDRIVAFAATATPADFGAIAPMVTAAAAEGDPVARQILQVGADDIAQGLHAMGWKDGSPVCLTGGTGPAYADYLPAGMRASLRVRSGEPIDGAVALARDLA